MYSQQIFDEMNTDEVIVDDTSVIVNSCTNDSINNVGEYLDCTKVMFERRLMDESKKQSSLEDFILHRTIGIGAFGRVLLVNHKSDVKTFLAMKVRNITVETIRFVL